MGDKLHSTKRDELEFNELAGGDQRGASHDCDQRYTGHYREDHQQFTHEFLPASASRVVQSTILIAQITIHKS